MAALFWLSYCKFRYTVGVVVVVVARQTSYTTLQQSQMSNVTDSDIERV